MSDPERDILVITGNPVIDTGRVSFMFQVLADKERKLHPMPQKFGWVWSPEPGNYSFNVFEGGKGLVVGGGWSPSDSPAWQKEMIDALPSCTLLMDLRLFPWFKNMMDKAGAPFRHHHFDGPLTTS